MQLSPDEIERRAFAIEDRGYDRDEVRELLVAIAAALRGERSPGPIPAPPASADRDEFARAGTEVAEILRAAHDAVAALHVQADREIATRAEETAARSDELRRQAETDAVRTHDQAKRLLVTAQEQADAIVTDAQARAASIIETARRHAEDQAEQVNSRTRRHADQILRAEREALRRLHQAQAGVASAVEMLTGSETRPVVDLTELRPNVRLGSLDAEICDPNELRDRSADDPVARMIRSAVDLASAHAQGAARRDDPGSIEPDPSPPAEAGAVDPGALVPEPDSTEPDCTAPVAAALVSPPGPAQPPFGAATWAATDPDPSREATY